MGTFSGSFQLVKESFAVLRKDKEMLWFPIISAILSIIVFVSFLVPLIYTNVQKGEITSYWFYLFLFIFYLIICFITIFFNTGLVTCAHMRLKGKNPTFKDGFENAKKHIWKIFIWALISATIGVILHLISRRAKHGRIATSIIGAAWTLLTVFVIPIMVFEDVGIKEAIKKSASLFKKTWGENVVGHFSIGLFFVILTFFGLIPLFLLFFIEFSSISTLIALIACMVIYWTILSIISSALNGIFLTALYIYANTGKIPSSYSKEVVKDAFIKPKLKKA